MHRKKRKIYQVTITEQIQKMVVLIHKQSPYIYIIHVYYDYVLRNTDGTLIIFGMIVRSVIFGKERKTRFLKLQTTSWTYALFIGQLLNTNFLISLLLKSFVTPLGSILKHIMAYILQDLNLKKLNIS